MTRSCFLYTATLVLQSFLVFAFSENVKTNPVQFNGNHIQQELGYGQPSEFGTEGILLGMGWNVEHSGHSYTKFHHEEDGHFHGFCFDRLNRRSWFRKASCLVLKCILVVVHIVLIIVAFLHTLH